ncbi:MAG: hypothetical protein AAGF84_05970 [Planctomycetota bacterium]
MNEPNVRESRGSDDAPRAEPRGERYRWVPPLVALLLLAIVLLTLINPDGGAGDGNPDTQGAGIAEAGPGQGNDDKELGGTSAGQAEALGGRDSQRDGTPAQAGTAAVTTPPASSQPESGVAIQSRIEPESSAPSDGLLSNFSSVTTAAPPLPALGFATDLAAAPNPQPKPTVTATRTAAPAGNESAGSTGTPGLASFFGAQGHGTKFAYLIDKSGSMSGAPFAAAKAELIRSLRALQPHEKFFIAFYDGSAEFMPGERLLPATPSNVERAVAWVRSVSLGGSTNPTEALTHTLTRVRPDTIWLLSDGAFSAGVVDTIAQHNVGRRTHINTLAFIDRAGEALLKIIADENNGDYRYIPRP